MLQCCVAVPRDELWGFVRLAKRLIGEELLVKVFSKSLVSVQLRGSEAIGSDEEAIVVPLVVADKSSLSFAGSAVIPLGSIRVSVVASSTAYII